MLLLVLYYSIAFGLPCLVLLSVVVVVVVDFVVGIVSGVVVVTTVS